MPELYYLFDGDAEQYFFFYQAFFFFYQSLAAVEHVWLLKCYIAFANVQCFVRE